jgi:hypothetical protein
MVSIARNTDLLKRTSAPKLQKLARFKTVRRLYSQSQKLIQNVRPSQIVGSQSQIFPTPIDKQKCQQELLSLSVYPLESLLNQEIVNKIHTFAISNPCIEPQSNQVFCAKDVDNQKPDAKYIYRGLVTDLDKCPEIEQVTSNVELIEIAENFLGYYPTEITQHLTWSFVVPESEDKVQKSYPPANWHYDVAGMNFVTVSFYITDVMEIEAGAHILLPGSQKNKPISMLLNNNIQQEEVVFKHYQKSEQMYLTGKAGYGFVEDPSCLHRVKVPTTQNRLILQIRYS